MKSWCPFCRYLGRSCSSHEPKPRKLSAEETERIRRTPSIPQFDPRAVD